MQTEQQNPLATQKVSSLILKFTIPAIISMMVSSLYNIVDQVFIGQGVGMLGNAATNIAFPVNIICTAVALLLGIGSASNFNLKSGVTLAVLQIFTDKEMYFYLAAFAAAAVIVSCVRRLSVDHARTIAIVLGIAVQLGVICSGEIYLGETGQIVRVILGCMVSLVIALVLDFMILSVDYSRVEHTQFEDDEYYYYVRAVPKAFVSVEDKQVKHINAKRTKKRKSTRGKKVNSVHVNTEKEIGDELEEQVLKELHDK